MTEAGRKDFSDMVEHMVGFFGLKATVGMLHRSAVELRTLGVVDGVEGAEDKAALCRDKRDELSRLIMEAR